MSASTPGHAVPDPDNSDSGAPESLSDQLAGKLADKLKDSTEGVLGEALAEDVSEHVKEEASDAIDEVLDQVEDVLEEQAGIEIEFDEITTPKGLLVAMRETGIGIASAFVGDVKLFWAIFRTLGVWFLKPLSHDVIALAQERKEHPDPDGKYRYFLDFKLVRAIFGLSLFFLVVEESVEGASTEEWAAKIVFFLFYGVLLFGWIIGGWIWFKIMGIRDRNIRRFIGFLIYEYATIYMISFSTLVLLPLEETSIEVLFSWFLPWGHTVYFVWCLLRFYNISSGLKRVLGLASATIGLGVFTLLAPAFVAATLTDDVQQGASIEAELPEDVQPSAEALEESAGQ